jgi:hypothetical protein
MIAVACAQGAYFLATGVWSLVDIQSFQRVTGRKTDLWLVRVVGVLVAALGSALLWNGVSGPVSQPMALAAALSAFGLMAVELVYVLRRVISPVYAVDAGLELAFLLWWAAELSVGRG